MAAVLISISVDTLSENACLGPPCHACPAKRSCGSDITLGDFWGIQSSHPGADIEDGVSAVICNTAKGEAVFGSLGSCVDCGESSFDKVLLGNPSLTKSVMPHARREKFMRELEAGRGIKAMMGAHDFEPTLWQRLRRKTSAVMRRMFEFVRGRFV